MVAGEYSVEVSKSVTGPEEFLFARKFKEAVVNEI